MQSSAVPYQSSEFFEGSVDSDVGMVLKEKSKKHGRLHNVKYVTNTVLV